MDSEGQLYSPLPAEGSPVLVIQSKEDPSFSVEADPATLKELSSVVKRHLDDCVDERCVVSLSKLPEELVVAILGYCSALSSNDPARMKQWEEQFWRLTPNEMCAVASGAYQLDIKPLVAFTCKAVADNIKGKEPEQIRHDFKIPYDWTPDDNMPPPTIRDKLRRRHQQKRRERERPRDGDGESASLVDTRSVDELLSFIEAPAQPGKTPSKSGVRKSPRSASSEAASVSDGTDDRPTPASPSQSRAPSVAKVNASDDGRAVSSAAAAEQPDAADSDAWDGSDLDREIEEFRRKLEQIEVPSCRTRLPPGIASKLVSVVK